MDKVKKFFGMYVSDGEPIPDFDKAAVSEMFMETQGLDLKKMAAAYSGLATRAKMIHPDYLEGKKQHKYIEQMSQLYGSPYRGLLSNSVSFFLGFGPLALFGPTLPKSLSTLEKMILISTPSVTGSLLRLPGGAMTDLKGGFYGTFFMLWSAVIGLTILSLLIMLAPNEYGIVSVTYWLKFFAGLLSGCGIAVFPIGIANTAFHFPRKDAGKFVNIFAGIGNLGPAFFSAFIPVLMQEFGIVAAHWICMASLFFGALFVMFTFTPSMFHQFTARGFSKDNAYKVANWLGQELIPINNFPDNAICKGKVNENLVIQFLRITWDSIYLIRIYTNLTFVIAYICCFGGYLYFTSTLPIFWRDHHGLIKTYAGYLTMGYSAGASIGRAVAGGYVDKLDSRTGGLATTIVALTVNIIGILPMVFIPSGADNGLWIIPAAIGTAFLSAGTAVANAAVFKAIPYYMPDDVGKVGGLVGGIGATGGWIFPILSGIFALILSFVITGEENAPKRQAMSYLVVIPLTLVAIVMLCVLIFLKREAILNWSPEGDAAAFKKHNEDTGGIDADFNKQGDAESASDSTIELNNVEVKDDEKKNQEEELEE